jgi:hypothetical protein
VGNSPSVFARHCISRQWPPHELTSSIVTLRLLVALTRASLSPRRRRYAANAQRLARMTEGGIVTRVGELPTTLPFPPARRGASRDRGSGRLMRRYFESAPSAHCAREGDFAPCPVPALSRASFELGERRGFREVRQPSRRCRPQPFERTVACSLYIDGGAVKARRVSATSNSERHDAAGPIMRAPSNGRCRRRQRRWASFPEPPSTPPAQPKAARHARPRQREAPQNLT